MTTDERLRQIRRVTTMSDTARARGAELRAEGRTVREVAATLRAEGLADVSYPTVWRELFAGGPPAEERREHCGHEAEERSVN